MRNRHLAAIPLAALLLTACASATDTVPLTTPTPEPTATATPTPAAGDFAWLNRHESSFNSGDAYYEMVYRNHGGLLLKTDYATAAQTVACTVPGCTHDSADCPAWFPGRYSYYCPFVADGAVYVLNASFFHTDQTWEEYREEYLTPQLDSTDLTPEELEAHYYGLWQQQSAAPQVYRLTDDGKTCIDLPAECVDYVFDFCDDTALYGVMTSGNNGQNTKAVRVDLTTGELQSVPLEPTEYFVTCYDGALLTVRYVTDAPLPDDFEQFRAAVQSATVEFDRYDPRTGERRKLIERPYNIADERLSGYLGTHNGKLYFEEREALQGGGYNRGALQEYDPADGSTAAVWDAPPAGSNLWDYQDTYTNVLPARGSRAEDWLWLYGTDGAVGGNRCYLMNAAARELVPITQRMKNYTYNIPPSLLAQTADGRWLLWTESNDENAHVAYGLIAPNDFAAGSTDYTPVEMWAG